MSIYIKKTYILLFFIGLFFLPFNNVSILPIGEFERESCFYFFLSSSLILFLYKNINISIPTHNIALIIYFFIFSTLFITLFNLPEIKTNYFKQTSGVVRLIKQYSVLLMVGAWLFIYFWNIIHEFSIQKLLINIRKALLFSLSFCSLVGLFETLGVIYKIKIFGKLFELFNYLPFINVTNGNYSRIKTVSFEPPFLAIFLISIFGWMLSYIITEKKWYKFIPANLVLLLTHFSGSRTALIVITIQLVIFIILNIKKFNKDILKFIISISLFFTFIYCLPNFTHKVGQSKSLNSKLHPLDLKMNLSANVSNKSRFGMQYASLKVFEHHPLIGVGLGQQAYYTKEFYPEWATKNNYEFDKWFKNENVKSFPPGFNIYTRLLAELGIFGFIIFAFLILSVIYYSFKLQKSFDPLINIWGNILLISFIGLSVNWMQIDTFRIFTFWIYTAILIYILTQKKLTNE